MSAGSFGINNHNWTYLESREKLHAIQDTNLNLLNIIKEVVKIIEVLDKGLTKINSTRTLFTKDHKFNPAELAWGEETHTKPPLDDGKTQILLTQPPSKF